MAASSTTTTNGTLTHKQTMENLYVKLGWPEYQAYQQIDGFDENSYFCSDDNSYFIQRNWLLVQDEMVEPDSSTTIDYNGTVIELYSRYAGKGSPSWEKGEPMHNHKVTIKVGDKKHTFDYWSGLAFYQTTTVMTSREMMEALESFLSDCVLADQSIDDFQSELYYKKVSDCIRAYNACKSELRAWGKFGIDHYKFVDWLREKYDL